MREIRNEAGIREIRDLEDHLAERARREQQHRDNLLEAASRLDARAVFQEMKRFKRESGEFEGGFSTKDRRAREDTQKQIDQVNETAKKRREAEQANDEQRIAEIVAAFEEQKAVELEQKEERRQAIIDEFTENMAELDRQNAEKLQQIRDQAIREKMELERKAAEQINTLAGTEGKKLQIVQQSNAQTLAEMNKWANAWNAQVRAALSSSLDNGPSRAAVIQPPIPSASRSSLMTSAVNERVAANYSVPKGRFFASGTADTGMGGWTDPREGVLNATTAQIARDILGANYTQPQMQNFLRSGAGGNQYGDVNIYGDVGNYSRSELMEVFMQAVERREAQRLHMPGVRP